MYGFADAKKFNNPPSSAVTRIQKITNSYSSHTFFSAAQKRVFVPLVAAIYSILLPLTPKNPQQVKSDSVCYVVFQPPLPPLSGKKVKPKHHRHKTYKNVSSTLQRKYSKQKGKWRVYRDMVLENTSQQQLAEF